jgi:hypothetical protein
MSADGRRLDAGRVAFIQENAVGSVTNLRKITPVLIVERIEPVLGFWKKLGLTAVTEVPDQTASDGRLAFVILAAEGVEIMYQTIASIKQDLVTAAQDAEAIPAQPQRITLFIEVGRLSELESALQGERLFMPRRKTFYGSTELGFADPAGNIVVFAEMEPRPA